jgi:hypothetical protein
MKKFDVLLSSAIAIAFLLVFGNSARAESYVQVLNVECKSSCNLTVSYIDDEAVVKKDFSISKNLLNELIKKGVIKNYADLKNFGMYFEQKNNEIIQINQVYRLQ